MVDISEPLDGGHRWPGVAVFRHPATGDPDIGALLFCVMQPLFFRTAIIGNDDVAVPTTLGRVVTGMAMCPVARPVPTEVVHAAIGALGSQAQWVCEDMIVFIDTDHGGRALLLARCRRSSHGRLIAELRSVHRQNFWTDGAVTVAAGQQLVRTAQRRRGDPANTGGRTRPGGTRRGVDAVG